MIGVGSTVGIAGIAGSAGTLGLTSLAQSLGLTGVFAARMFVPVFAAALAVRFGPSMPLIDQWGLLGSVDPQAAPTWFTHDITLIVLGVLAAAELLSQKVPELRQLLNEVDQYIKPAAAALTVLGIASVTDQQFIESLSIQTTGSPMGPIQAGVGAWGLAAAVGAGTWFVAGAHNALLRDWIEVDESDDTGAMRVLSWGQDLWSTLGLFFLILFPLLMGLLVLLMLGLLVLLRYWAQVREERAKVVCTGCAQPMFRSALACGHCGASNPAPMRPGWLGTATATAADDSYRQALQLSSFRRCRSCATRLPRRTPDQACPTCQTRPFDSPAFLADYDAMIAGRLPMVLLLGGLLSLIPVVGLIPGMIYYRLALVAPFRRYLSLGRCWLLRWLITGVAFFLILLQVVPGLGVVTVPVLALLNYLVYRHAFRGQVGEMLRGARKVAE